MSTTVYAVKDQHGMGITVFFAKLEDAQAYRERQCQPVKWPGKYEGPTWRPSFVIVPTVVWDSLAERDEAPE